MPWQRRELQRSHAARPNRKSHAPIPIAAIGRPRPCPTAEYLLRERPWRSGWPQPPRCSASPLPQPCLTAPATPCATLFVPCVLPTPPLAQAATKAAAARGVLARLPLPGQAAQPCPCQPPAQVPGPVAAPARLLLRRHPPPHPDHPRPAKLLSGNAVGAGDVRAVHAGPHRHRAPHLPLLQLRLEPQRHQERRLDRRILRLDARPPEPAAARAGQGPLPGQPPDRRLGRRLGRLQRGLPRRHRLPPGRHRQARLPHPLPLGRGRGVCKRHRAADRLHAEHDGRALRQALVRPHRQRAVGPEQRQGAADLHGQEAPGLLAARL